MRALLVTVLALGLLGAQLGSLTHATKHVLEGAETACHVCTLAGLLGKGPATTPTMTLAPPQLGAPPIRSLVGVTDPPVVLMPPSRAPPYSA